MPMVGSMLAILMLCTAWLLVMAVVLAVCRMAQRGDAARAAQQRAEQEQACVTARSRKRAPALQLTGDPRRPQRR